MGSRSDWETMSHTAETLQTLGVPFETRVVSAHRTPDAMFEYASTAEERGLEVDRRCGGAALAGMAAAKTTLWCSACPCNRGRSTGSTVAVHSADAGGRRWARWPSVSGRGQRRSSRPRCSPISTHSFATLRRYRDARTQDVLDHPDLRSRRRARG
ncbi:MAG: AIR carboxylase family protein [Chloroflexia bacterium]